MVTSTGLNVPKNTGVLKGVGVSGSAKGAHHPYCTSTAYCSNQCGGQQSQQTAPAAKFYRLSNDILVQINQAMSALVKSTSPVDDVKNLSISDDVSKNPAKSTTTTSDDDDDEDKEHSPATGGKTDNPNISSGTDEKVVSEKSLLDFVKDGKDTSNKAIRIMKVFLGIEEETDENYGLKWGKETIRDGIEGRSSHVVGNTWNAVIAKTRVAASQTALLDLLFNDSRIMEYDDMFDSYKVRVG